MQKKIKIFLMLFSILVIFGLTSCKKSGEYSIKYVVDEGIMPDVYATKYNENDSDISLPAPSKEGYTFGGWYDNPRFLGAATIKITSGTTGDLTFYAKWVVATFKVEFNMNGHGKDIDSQMVQYGQKVEVPPVPTATGYTFVGWYIDAALNISYDFSKEVKSERTLYAKWEINKYNLTFTVDGKTYESGEKEFGESIKAPKDPSKVGYTFIGWDSEIPAKMPAKDLNFNAKWSLNKYKINYELDGGILDGLYPTTYTIEDDDITLPVPLKEGYTFLGWFDNVDFIGEEVTTIKKGSTEEVTIYAKWSINTFTVDFNLLGHGSEILSQKVNYGSTAKMPLTPSEVGYTFSGWFTDEECTSAFNFNISITSDLTLYAKWEINQYTLSFDTSGGSIIDKMILDYGSPIDLTNLIPTRDGYSFAGWGDDVPSTMPAYDLTLKAEWNIVTYQIMYFVNDGVMPDNYITSYTIESNSFVLPLPTKNGYHFDGWYELEDFTGYVVSMIAKGTCGTKVFYAKWTLINYKITYYLDGGINSSSNPDTYTILSSDIKLERPTKAGFTFIGWTSPTLDDLTMDVTIKTGSTGDVFFTANWGQDTYTITYHVNDGIMPDEYPTSFRVDSDSFSLPLPTKKGFTFGGWYQDSSYLSNPMYSVERGTYKNLELYAKWNINYYKITFDTAGGNQISSLTFAYDSLIVLPDNPIKDGYKFLGWDIDVPEKMPDYDLNLTALWSIITYTITYNLDGGKITGKYIENYNIKSLDIILPIPSKEGYKFDGWYLNQKFDGEAIEKIKTGSTGNLVLYAKWNVDKHTITFDNNGLGIAPELQIVDYGSKVVRPNDLVETGYTFVGWYQEKTCINEYDFNTLVTGDFTLYAKWEINEYKITFDTSGGTPIDPIVLKYNSTILLNVSSTKDGYRFNNFIEEVPEKMPAHDLKLTVKWDLVTYNITYVLSGGEIEGEYVKDYTIETPNFFLPVPHQTGYKFIGWFIDEDGSTNAITEIPLGSFGDLTLYAKWQINGYKVTFVDLMLNTKTIVQVVDYNTQAKMPVMEGVAGYTFDAWYQDSNLTKIYDFSTLVTEDITLYAKWNLNEYTLTLLVNGEVYLKVKKLYLANIEKIDDPIVIGYNFIKWEREIPATMPAGDLTIEAVMEEVIYTIEYDLDGGTNDLSNPKEFTINTPTIILLAPVKEGYSFKGWYDNVECIGASIERITIGTTMNIKLFAKWEINQYTLTFIVGDEVLTKITQDYNTVITKPDDPTKTGYTFIGWDKEVPTNMPACDMTFTAQFDIITYAITYVLYDGSFTGKYTSNYTVETPTFKLENPTKTGYTFMGWYNSDDFNGNVITEVNKGTIGDLTFYAKWQINTYTITFVNTYENAGKGTLPPSQLIEYGSKVKEPDELVCTGYTFDGWYLDYNCYNLYDFDTLVTGDLTLYANWITNTYTIKFIVDGEVKRMITQYYDTLIPSIDDPVLQGFTFVGWNQEIPQRMPAYNMEITAIFKINQYTLTFMVDDVVYIEIKGDYKSKVTIPTPPVKEGYKFMGWDQEIPSRMPAYNMTFKAIFQEIDNISGVMKVDIVVFKKKDLFK